VSRDFGQLVVMRHLISGVDCAIAGAAIVAPTTPAPVALMKSRRFIENSLPLVIDVQVSLRFEAYLSMEHPVRDFHDEPAYRIAKSPAFEKDRAFLLQLKTKT
jgi:hypothetical protein